MTITSLTQITNNTTPQRAQSAPEPEPEPRDRVDRGVIHEAASRTLGLASGLALSFNRMIEGGCAGAGQGVVKATGIEGEQSEMAFKVAMGANLAVSGALAGGLGYESLALSPAQGAVAGAVTNTIIGQTDWQASPPSFQQRVRGTATEWVDSSLSKLPPSLSQDQGLAARVVRGVVGEVVGLSAGVYATATELPKTFQDGYAWGTDSVDKMAAWMAPAPDGEKS